MPAHRTVRAPGGGTACAEHKGRTGGLAAAEIPFQFPWRALRRRTPNGLRRVEAAFHATRVYALFRASGLVHVAGNLPFQAARAGAQDSGTDGLDDRTFLPS